MAAMTAPAIIATIFNHSYHLYSSTDDVVIANNIPISGNTHLIVANTAATAFLPFGAVYAPATTKIAELNKPIRGVVIRIYITKQIS